MLKAASTPLFGFTYWKLHKKIKYDTTCVILVINSLFGCARIPGCIISWSADPFVHLPHPHRGGGGRARGSLCASADPKVHPYSEFVINVHKNKISKKTRNCFDMKFLWNLPKALRNSTILFFSFKIAYFSQFRMISVGGATWIHFLGCTKGSADARKDPQMHERIRLAYPPRLLGLQEDVT